MDAPPIPKPRSLLPPENDPAKQPVPMPRTKIPEVIERSKSVSILRSLSTVSKVTSDVANMVASTAKAAKSDTKFYTPKSSLKLRKTKKIEADENTNRHVSMPCADMTLFENIQFHSPMLEQKRYKNEDGLSGMPSLALNTTHLDDLSLFSSNSDSNTGSVSDFSRDSTEFEHNQSSLEIEQTTYDTPRQSRTGSIISDMAVEVPERRVRQASEVSFMRMNSMYENWTLPLSRVNSKDTSANSDKNNDDKTNNENAEYRPSKSTIIEFDPLNTSKTSKKYDGVSNELLLLESFLIGDTYGSIISTDTHDDSFEFTESDYFNPPTPPERSDSLFTVRPEAASVVQVVKDANKPLNDVKKSASSSVIHKFSQMLKLDNVLHKPAKQETNNMPIVERPPINNLQVPYFCGVLTRMASSVGEDLFKNPQSRYCVLATEQLMCYTDPTNSVLKEAYTLDNVHSVQIVLPISTSNLDLKIRIILVNYFNAEYRPSKSTIIEFDPLNTSKTSKKYDGVSNELLLLESFLIGDTYGSIISTDTHDDSFEFTESDYFNPPTPPERSDSLFTVRPEAASVVQVVKDANKPLNDVKKSASSSVIHKFSQMLKLDNVLHKPAKQETNNMPIVERPPINNLQVPYFCGVLTRMASSVGEDLFKNPQSRYCVLATEQLMCYTDPTNSVLKEAYTLDNVHSVQIVLPISTSTNPNSFCFELMISSGGGRHSPRKVIFSAESAAVRRNWSHNLAAHLTIFPTKFTTDFTRCGWCYLKEGVTGEWHGVWVILHRRVLAYYTGRETTVYTVDLRKARCVVTQEADEETKKSCQSECADNLLLDCPNATLYLHFPYEKELKSWRFMVRLAAHNNGTHLYHQQLTKEDVPVIVDKCLSFVYAHGSLSEGIYRRAGANATITDLLTRFRRDAWSVQLTHGELTEHDVAGALKRFFRELPEPLIPRNKHQELLDAQGIETPSDRFEVYKRVMLALPVVVANTARRLFAHLNFLQSMTYANRMGSENLAAVWAPTLMPAAMTNDPLQTSWNAYLYVIKDLIVNAESIWEPTEAEKRREAAIRRVLVKVHGSPATVAPKAAGDLKAWIYVGDKNTCYQIALTPNKTCSDILIELSDKAKTFSHLLMLEEIICDNAMRRIVHPDEIVLDVVLRWGYWDEEDRKDNYLLLQENSMLQQIEHMRQHVKTISGLVKFANETTRHFKTYYFALEGDAVCYYKDKQGSQKVEEWKVKDYIWYMGHEAKRPPSALWSITFISKNMKPKRSKDKPWFGSTMAGVVAKNDFKWIAALMSSEHAELLPTPRLIDT